MEFNPKDILEQAEEEVRHGRFRAAVELTNERN